MVGRVSDRSERQCYMSFNHGDLMAYIKSHHVLPVHLKVLKCKLTLVPSVTLGSAEQTRQIKAASTFRFQSNSRAKFELVSPKDQRSSESHIQHIINKGLCANEAGNEEIPLQSGFRDLGDDLNSYLMDVSQK